jgi:hypothetical protein
MVGRRNKTTITKKKQDTFSYKLVMSILKDFHIRNFSWKKVFSMSGNRIHEN